MATKRLGSTLTGAAFLMAVSAIGPGFMTQTTQFTSKLGASLAFLIVVSTLIDIGAQLNTWRVVCISGKRGDEIAHSMVPGLGWVVTGVIVAGSFVFNLGNFSGCALGLRVLLEWDTVVGLFVSAGLGVALFLMPRALAAMDTFSKVLGAGMIVMTGYIVWMTRPPVVDAARQALWPDQFEIGPLVTMVGGTVGGYIMFSGAHRLLDGGVTGVENLGRITWASAQGILIAGIMRVVLFLAVLGVLEGGHTISEREPVFDAFRAGAGEAGYLLSGLIFWCAAITSVVGCSYTAVSFLGVESQRRRSVLTIVFLVLSLAVTVALHMLEVSSTRLLIAAGTINGVLLPIILGVVLIGAYRRSLVGAYRHRWWAGAFGLATWCATVYFAYRLVMP